MKLRIVLPLLFIAAVACRAQDLYDDTRVLEFRLTFSQPNWKTLLTQNVTSETDIPATLSVNGTVLDSVGVRYKGNSSYNVSGNKKPFNITTDAYRKGQEYLGYSTFNLNNFFKDPTFVREIIAYHLAGLYLPSEKTAYVKLYINNVYWGLYLHVQQPNRTFLREQFGNDSGNHYKGDPRGELAWFGADTAKYRASYELKTNEARNDWSDLVDFIRILNTTPAGTMAEQIATVLDVDRALWYIAFSNILCNLDSYIGSGHNYYAYHNPDDDRFAIIPWDLNEVLGTFSQQLSLIDRERLTYAYAEQNPGRPLVSKLITVPQFRARYIAHYRTMLSEAFTREYWMPRIERYQNLIRDAVIADSNKLYTLASFSDNVVKNVTVAGPIGGMVPGVLSFIDNRRAALLAMPDLMPQQAVISAPVLEPAKPVQLQAARVRASVAGASSVALYWSVDGARFASTPMSPSANGYEASIPGQKLGAVVRYYIEAYAPSGAAVYLPARAEHDTYAFTASAAPASCPIVINEVMGLNHATLADPQGDYDDWIELYNNSDTTYHLGGCYLSTSVTSTHKWRVPDGVSIAGRGYLLVWADEDTLDTPGLHASFKLSKDGEAVYLFDAKARGNALIDSSAFSTYQQDAGWARSPNGTGQFMDRWPTPEANNDIVNAVELPPMAGNVTLQVYPNPVTASRLSVRVGRSVVNVVLHLCDVLGRAVAQAIVHGNGVAQIDVSALPSGVYLLRAETGGRVAASSLVRIHH
jgi:hypothetical protein